MPDPVVDQAARTEVAEVRHDLANHKMVTEIKLDGLLKVVAELKSQLKWAGGLIVMLFISTLTWSLAQQYNANETQKTDMKQQIELLRSAEASRIQARRDILERLPSGGTEAAGGPSGVAESRNLDDDRANNRR